MNLITFFSRDSNLTTSPKDEDMLKIDVNLTTSPKDEDMLKIDVDMFIHKLLIIKFNHIPNYTRLLVRRLWDRDQCY